MQVSGSRQVEQKRRRCLGCTLIEIMTLLVLVSMILGVVGFFTWRQYEKGKRNVAFYQVCLFERVLKRYQLKHHRMPTNDEGLQVLVEEGLIKKECAPSDPWGNKYVYRYPGKRPSGMPDVFSYGADGREGGVKAAADIHCQPDNQRQ